MLHCAELVESRPSSVTMTKDSRGQSSSEETQVLKKPASGRKRTTNGGDSSVKEGGKKTLEQEQKRKRHPTEDSEVCIVPYSVCGGCKSSVDSAHR
jgi:hypothetical protein